MSKYLVVSLILVSIIIGFGTGYMLSPQYAQSASEESMQSSSAKSGRNYDLSYIDSMIKHHRGAILLAMQAKDTTERVDVRNLAHEILKSEPKAIDELYSWKKDWYGNTTRLQDPKVVKLGDYDENFDLRFLNALIAHHEAGVEMAKEAQLSSSRNEVLVNAEKVASFLEKGISSFSAWRYEWYGLAPRTNMEGAKSVPMDLNTYTDAAFIDDMIAHHNGAVKMAEDVVKNTKRSELRNMGEDIITAQRKEIDDLYAWKKVWFDDSNVVTKIEGVNLGAYDKNYDLRFLNAMVKHHEDAVAMSQKILGNSTRNEILDLGNAIVINQTREINQMRSWRSSWFNVPATSNESMNK